MKITGFNPAVITSRYDDTVKLFESLGFERRHQNEEISGTVTASTRLKNEEGFVIDINKAEELPRDITLIRMNVDNFDECYQLFKERGFKNAMGGDTVIEEPFLKGAHIISPSGFGIMLMQHIKK
jgi:hypothetical protein